MVYELIIVKWESNRTDGESGGQFESANIGEHRIYDRRRAQRIRVKIGSKANK